jgi:23S rRNA (guanosine2251-2'-O)-methyltransferase
MPPGQKADIIVGRVPVFECLRAGKRAAHTLYIQTGAQGLEHIAAKAGKIPVKQADRATLDRLARGVLHQGVVLEAAPLPVLDLHDLLESGLPGGALLMILDGVEDPHNFGAIVRSAAACGAHAVLFAKDRAAPLSAAMTKAAAGAVEYIALVEVTNLVRAMGQLQEAGCWLAALEANAAQDLWDADLTGRMGIVVGSEGKGVRRLVRERCDLVLRIPLAGPINSLNASVAAGAVLTECLRQRRAHAVPH